MKKIEDSVNILKNNPNISKKQFLAEIYDIPHCTAEEFSLWNEIPEETLMQTYITIHTSKGVTILRDGTVDIPEEEPSPTCEIPQKFKDCERKVFINTFICNQTVFNSRVQLKIAAEAVALDSGASLALLLLCGKHVGAVKASASCLDFVRALISLGSLPLMSDKEIHALAKAAYKKINPDHGESLKLSYQSWPKDVDRLSGERITKRFYMVLS